MSRASSAALIRKILNNNLYCCNYVVSFCFLVATTSFFLHVSISKKENSQKNKQTANNVYDAKVNVALMFSHRSSMELFNKRPFRCWIHRRCCCCCCCCRCCRIDRIESISLIEMRGGIMHYHIYSLNLNSIDGTETENR